MLEKVKKNLQMTGQSYTIENICYSIKACYTRPLWLSQIKRKHLPVRQARYTPAGSLC